MQSLWDDQQAAGDDLAERVYSSRLIGKEPTLVLHGGGNTSVKLTLKTLYGEEDILYIKGSGWNLATITEVGFARVRLKPLLQLAQLDHLSDSQMANELRCNTIDAQAPMPSVEAILHALLPYKYVDHTHADALIAISNSVGGDKRLQEIYGDCAIILPYVMPGFQLARQCAVIPPEQFTGKIGMVLLHHGLVSFGSTGRESYERMIELVSRAEDYLQRQSAWQIVSPTTAAVERPLRAELATLRRKISDAAGFPAIMALDDDPQTHAFAQRDDLDDLTQQGPATPDHVIRTKRLPLVGDDVDAYAKAYRRYFHQQAANRPLTMLDPAPRVILHPNFGLLTVGRSARDGQIAADIYHHTIDIILRANALGGYRALPPQDIFEVEYWELEQAKLAQAVQTPPLLGEIGLVTGAASGIGKACVDSLLARGAAVVGLDINPAIMTIYQRPDYLGVQCDVIDENAVCDALEAGTRRFGGLDILVLNAGIFPPSARIESLKMAEWDRVMRINLDSNLTFLREAHLLLKHAPRGGKVAIIGSKNVPAPGPGAAAYSASKAALNQLARVAALEWGSDGIRVNVVHPNAVFDTGIWSEEILQARAKNYGLGIEQYKTNNVLHVEVTSHDVGELVAELCTNLFAKTTGAQIPIDGGNDRVI